LQRVPNKEAVKLGLSAGEWLDGVTPIQLFDTK
jgi:hypothetical protein